MSEFIKYLKDNQHSPNLTRAQAFAMGQKSKQDEIDSLNKQLSEIKDKYILRGQEIDLLNRKIYDKDQIIEACLYSDDKEEQND